MALTLRAAGLLALSLATLLVAPARADERLWAGLREEIVTLQRPGLIALDLEATLYLPPGDVATVPGLDAKGRAAYADFLGKPQPRAFALGPHGTWHWRAGSPAATRLALADCEIATHRQPCQRHAVDDPVVWRAPSAWN